jgi:monosaccharide-transporting ATPase
MTGDPKPVLEARGVVHAYSGKPALDGVDFCLRAGEIHALMGQNGAGKSTLIKVLTGVEPLQSGSIHLAGASLRPASTLDAQQAGISTVYQEVNLCPNLSVAENIFAGRQPRKPWSRGGGIDWRQVNQRSRDLLKRLDVDLDVRRELGGYSVALQQMVAIARAIDISASVLILDEPTSSLDSDEVAQLFKALRSLRESGIAILFVTHFLDQVYAVCDRITVLRNGKLVGEYRTTELDHAALVAAMVGRAVSTENAPPSRAMDGPTQAPLISLRGVQRAGGVTGVNLDIRPGEILGLAGLLGSGRTEVARLLAGLDQPTSGEISLKGVPVSLADPGAAIAQGLSFCPEERKTEGVVDELSIRDNIVLSLQARLGIWRKLGESRRRELTDSLARQLDVRAASLDMPIGALSGGNQQKCLIARALATNPCLLILDEPTRGIDVAGKQEIMNLLMKLAAEGMALVFISAEVDELLRVCSRIVVMRDRAQVGELPGGANEDQVYALIAAPATASPA